MLKNISSVDAFSRSFSSHSFHFFSENSLEGSESRKRSHPVSWFQREKLAAISSGFSAVRCTSSPFNKSLMLGFSISCQPLITEDPQVDQIPCLPIPKYCFSPSHLFHKTIALEKAQTCRIIFTNNG